MPLPEGLLTGFSDVVFRQTKSSREPKKSKTLGEPWDFPFLKAKETHHVSYP